MATESTQISFTKRIVLTALVALAVALLQNFADPSSPSAESDQAKPSISASVARR